MKYYTRKGSDLLCTLPKSRSDLDLDSRFPNTGESVVEFSVAVSHLPYVR